MTKFLYTLKEQESYSGRFENVFEHKTYVVDEQHLEQSTCPETMRFFRNIGSKQEIRRRYKNSKEIIDILSYAPNSTTKRTVHHYEEI